MESPRCLICDLNPLTRADFDGLCLSCRAGVSDGLYRIQWLVNDSGVHYRAVVFATLAEDPLGCSWLFRVDPIVYDPVALPAVWRAIDREKTELARAELILNSITEFGK